MRNVSRPSWRNVASLSRERRNRTPQPCLHGANARMGPTSRLGGACEGRFLAYVAVMMESGPVTARARDLEGGGAARLTCEPCAAAHFGALPLPRD